MAFRHMGGSDERTRPTAANGMLYVNSGYAQWGGLPGNVPLTFEAGPNPA
jgi:polyvinyl alcohol dehydrogenase (cytochrome)